MKTLIPPLEEAAVTPAADIPVVKTPEAEVSVTDTTKTDDSSDTHLQDIVRTRTTNAERRREVCPFHWHTKQKRGEQHRDWYWW